MTESHQPDTPGNKDNPPQGSALRAALLDDDGKPIWATLADWVIREQWLARLGGAVITQGYRGLELGGVSDVMEWLVFEDSHDADQGRPLGWGDTIGAALDHAMTRYQVDEGGNAVRKREARLTFAGAVTALRELVKVQCSEGNWNYSPYMRGMANGMILALATLRGDDAHYLDEPGEYLEVDPASLDAKRRYEGLGMKVATVRAFCEAEVRGHAVEPEINTLPGQYRQGRQDVAGTVLAELNRE